MLAKILEMTTGKDDLKRVAHKEDMGLLGEYPKTRRILIPTLPMRFLDAADFTQGQLMELVEQGSKDLADDRYELWIVEVDLKKVLPAFSSQKKLESFSAKMSQDMNKVFSLGCLEVLLSDVVNDVDVDFIELNLFSEKSWEIGV